jgi:hypothetical protein
MTRSVRPILVLWLVALHMGLTLGGAGLHALPGLGHETGLNRLAKDDHSHGPGKSSHASADECPVCHFLAQGQALPDPPAGMPAWLITRADRPHDPVTALAPLHRPSVPRAPPTQCARPSQA